MFEGQVNRSGERRIGELFPFFNFLGKHGFVIMPLYDLQQRVLGLRCLYQHFSGFFFPTGTTTHLFHQLKGTLIDPVIGKMQETICIEDPYQVHIIKIQSLHHHLCADQDIHPVLFKLLNKDIMRIFSPD